MKNDYGHRYKVVFHIDEDPENPDRHGDLPYKNEVNVVALNEAHAIMAAFQQAEVDKWVTHEQMRIEIQYDGRNFEWLEEDK